MINNVRSSYLNHNKDQKFMLKELLSKNEISLTGQVGWERMDHVSQQVNIIH